MFGLVLVTHGTLATSFVSALENIMGPQECVKAICIHPQDDMDVHRNHILKAVEEVDTGQGVAVLTDLFGGISSNLAISISAIKQVEVLAGINMPMLVKLATVRATMPLRKALEMAQEYGRKYIRLVSNFLEKPCAENTAPEDG